MNFRDGQFPSSKIKTEKDFTNDIVNLSDELKIITENISKLNKNTNVTDIKLDESYNISVYLDNEEAKAIKIITENALKRERLEKDSRITKYVRFI